MQRKKCTNTYLIDRTIKIKSGKEWAIIDSLGLIIDKSKCKDFDNILFFDCDELSRERKRKQEISIDEIGFYLKSQKGAEHIPPKIF